MFGLRELINAFVGDRALNIRYFHSKKDISGLFLSSSWLQNQHQVCENKLLKRNTHRSGHSLNRARKTTLVPIAKCVLVTLQCACSGGYKLY